MRHTPCIVRARADSAYKSLYRAVPAQYDSRTKRYPYHTMEMETILE